MTGVGRNPRRTLRPVTTRKVVLFLTSKADVQAKRISHKLRKHNVSCFFLPPHQASHRSVTVEIGNSPETDITQLLFPTYSRVSIHLGEVRSVYCPRPLGFVKGIQQDEVEEFVELEHEAALDGALFSFLDSGECVWVNHPISSRLASYKILQLRLARQLGFKIPRTLFTNDVGALEKFYSSEGEIVAKVVNATPTTLPKRFIPTRLIGREAVSKKSAIRVCPVQYQKFIHKDCDVRVNVIGSQVFATAIYSTQIDGRVDIESAVHKTHHLPHDIEERCQLYCRRLGLSYGAIDLLLSHGEYYFLEINPNGKWGWIEDRTKQPLADAFANLLLGRL